MLQEFFDRYYDDKSFKDLDSILDEFKETCGEATGVYKNVVNNLELDLLDSGCKKIVADKVEKDDEDFTGVTNNLKVLCSYLVNYAEGSTENSVSY